jgi:predicted nucleic acid-binding protein
LILYLDTSSLIKLYVAENGTPEVEGLAIAASLVCTSVVAYPEARSAFARLCREGTLSPEAHARAKADLDRDWKHFLVIEVTEEVWRVAGDLAEEHALRGFDSIHLASFLHLVETDFGEPARFSSFDDRLKNALRREVEAALLREDVEQGLRGEE